MRNVADACCFAVALFATLLAVAQPTGISANSGSTLGINDRFNRPTPDSRGWTDPAVNQSRLYRERSGEGTYILVGTYKVTGTPFLFGQRLNADLFTPKEKAFNIYISYNTYDQEVEFNSTSNPGQPFAKTPGEVDSFLIKKDTAVGLVRDVLFIYGPLVGSSEKAYFQVIHAGPRFSLYKRYKSELGYPSSNYGQNELRQFDLIAEYFYSDAQQKIFKKIKPNTAVLTKEFKPVKDISPVADKEAIVTAPEEAMKRIFIYLNN